MSLVPVAPPQRPYQGVGVEMVMPPPTVGCGVDSGEAHRICGRRYPPMGKCFPPPYGCGVEV